MVFAKRLPAFFLILIGVSCDSSLLNSRSRLRLVPTAALFFAAAVALCLPAAVLGQSYEVLHAFVADGNGPQSPLIQASDGSLYGTTTRGGTFDQGTAFRIDSAGKMTILHSFAGNDGNGPQAGLIQAADGRFYGTTVSGGTNYYGTVFRMDSAGDLTTLHSFLYAEGANPYAGLIQATDGNFYGTTSTGGDAGGGTVFKMDSAGNLTALHSFPGDNGPGPQSALIQATDGNIYGTTVTGGTNHSGTLFRMDSTGKLTTLHNFTGPPNDGSYPYAGLIQATDGNFYGTTTSGGNSRGCVSGCGTVFKMGSSGNLTILHSFGYTVTDGVEPLAGVVQATDGNFYGTTYLGGAGNVGTVFRMDSTGNLTTLHDLAGNDGSGPYASLIQAADGNFYSTTYSGGTSNLGTVFKMNSSGDLTTLHSFGYTDGAYPHAGLIQASDGNFYGTTSDLDQYNRFIGYGTVFKMDSSGNLTTLHRFTGSSTDGAGPQAGLIQATDGNFYGTTSGGAIGHGTVFKMDSLGAVTTLHSFAGSPTDGAHPRASLIQATDGNFYGTSSDGGASGYGTVFKMDSASNVTTLHNFVGPPTDGAHPRASLIQATDGNFYGTSSDGGASGYGTVFKIDSVGNVTTLHNFAGAPSDGAYPVAGLIQAGDGNLYGTTDAGGAGSCIGGGGCGTVFKMDSAGNLTTLSNFAGGGVYPDAGLIQATDGNFYGTTSFDGVPHLAGSDNGGTVFKMDPTGNLTTLHNFEGSDVSDLFAGLIQARDGSFYGTAASGGSGGGGVVFRLTLRFLGPRVPEPPPPRLVPFRSGNPASIPIGSDQQSRTLEIDEDNPAATGAHTESSAQLRHFAETLRDATRAGPSGDFARRDPGKANTSLALRSGPAAHQLAAGQPRLDRATGPSLRACSRLARLLPRLPQETPRDAKSMWPWEAH